MRRIYGGLFFTSLGTIMYEILLTRIFSVTMWYHYAFMAISIAMFGMTTGAVLVYLLPRFFSEARAAARLTQASLFFALSIPPTFLIYLQIPFSPGVGAIDLGGLAMLALIYILIAIPFIWSGIVVCLALSKFPSFVSRLYAFDLAGAALGCALLVLLLHTVSGPTAVIAVAGVIALATVIFAGNAASELRLPAIAFFILCAVFSVANTLFAENGHALIKLRYMKTWAQHGNYENLIKNAVYEQWNSYSSVMALGDPAAVTEPFGWGLSDTTSKDARARQILLVIDADAGTPVTHFTGNLADIAFLKYDIVNMAHYLRQHANVLVVGAGGGRDILSALEFGQSRITGVEVNAAIVDATTKKFGDFAGHIEQYPQVRYVNDEARSFVSRSTDKFDIIQVSLVDTWAATAAGAFVLTENSLYTLEGWKEFLNHLSPAGILTVSRWYSKQLPVEAYRVAELAAESLKAIGVGDPRSHIVFLRKFTASNDPRDPDGIGTILVSRAPFSETDLSLLSQKTRELHFDEVLTPTTAMDGNLASAASADAAFVENFRFDIAPPRDDKPFFFQTLRLSDLPDLLRNKIHAEGKGNFNFTAMAVLLEILLVTIVLALLFIALPLVLHTGREHFSGSLFLTLYFMAIGAGFMLVETALLERLIIYLGNPVYSLSVILFSLLLAGGLGSYLSKRATEGGVAPVAKYVLFAIAALIVFGALALLAITTFTSAPLWARVALTTALVGLMGIGMGFCFPVGVAAASKRHAPLLPFLWGVNGALSVVASVLGVAIAITAGISFAFLGGIIAYTLAYAALRIFETRSA